MKPLNTGYTTERYISIYLHDHICKVIYIYLSIYSSLRHIDTWNTRNNYLFICIYPNLNISVYKYIHIWEPSNTWNLWYKGQITDVYVHLFLYPDIHVWIYQEINIYVRLIKTIWTPDIQDTPDIYTVSQQTRCMRKAVPIKLRSPRSFFIKLLSTVLNIDWNI